MMMMNTVSPGLSPARNLSTQFAAQSGKKRWTATQRQAMDEARIETATRLGCPIIQTGDTQKVDRLTLTKTFYTQYFQWLAKSLQEVDPACREKGYLNQTIGDVNLTESDFCANELLLDSLLPDDILNQGDIYYRHVLGYDDEASFEADYALCLQDMGRRLGMTQASPTEFEVFAKMEVMPNEALARAFQDVPPQSPPPPASFAPIKKMMMKKAIFRPNS